MNKEQLETLTRKELQKVAKENGIKANQKSSDIIMDLLELFKQSELQPFNSLGMEIVDSPSQQLIQSRVSEIIKKEEILEEQKVLTLPPVEKIDQKFDISLLSVSDDIKFTNELNISHGKIKRINKLSVRVTLSDGSEVTIQKTDITGYYNEVEEEQQCEILNQSNESILLTEPIEPINEIEQTQSQTQQPETQPEEHQSEKASQIETTHNQIQESLLENDVENASSSTSLPFCENNLEDTEEDTEIMTIEELEVELNDTSNVGIETENNFKTNPTTLNVVEVPKDLQKEEVEDEDVKEEEKQNATPQSPFKYNNEVSEYFLFFIFCSNFL